MKALVLICLLLAGCSNPTGEKKEVELPSAYRYQDLSFITTDSCITVYDESGEGKLTINSITYRLYKGGAQAVIVFDIK